MNKSVHCPICGGSNACRAGEDSCWCINETFPAELLNAVKKKYGDRECICAGCIRSYKSDPQSFMRGNNLGE